jgi:protein-S-isoprenylcysteine O-methyltransferase Ste14
MWSYLICAGIWLAIIFGWIIPVVRARQFYEVYMACGLGIYFSLMVLGWMWKTIDIRPLLYVGYAVVALGIAFVIPSFVSLRHKGKPESGWEPTTILIDSGVYRIVRHPLYLGSAIATLGIMLVIQSIPSTILGLVAIFCFWMVSRKEDAFNIKKFGDEYKVYSEKVPMWNVFRAFSRVRRKNHG